MLGSLNNKPGMWKLMWQPHRAARTYDQSIMRDHEVLYAVVRFFYLFLLNSSFLAWYVLHVSSFPPPQT